MSENTPFKMKGFSGFGNSPLYDHEKDKDGNIIKHKKEKKEDSKDIKTEETGLTGVVGGKKVTFTAEQLKNIGVE